MDDRSKTREKPQAEHRPIPFEEAVKRLLATSPKPRKATAKKRQKRSKRAKS